MVVEEPTATLDEKSVGHIDEALKLLAHDKTMILLPGRVSTLRAANHILLLHRGQVVGQGSHAELLQRSDLYRHLVYLRFNEFRGVVE